MNMIIKKQEDYMIRVKNEYNELKERYSKLNSFIENHPKTLKETTYRNLVKQSMIMRMYLYVLEDRAIDEGIEL